MRSVSRDFAVRSAERAVRDCTFVPDNLGAESVESRREVKACISALAFGAWHLASKV